MKKYCITIENWFTEYGIILKIAENLRQTIMSFVMFHRLQEKENPED